MKRDRRQFFRAMSGVAAMTLADCAISATPRNMSRPSSRTVWDSSTHLTGESISSSLPTIRDQFPALQQEINGYPLVYLDSAATTQRSRAVIDTMANFYEHDNANPSMSLHALARRSATLYEEARKTVARFVNARSPDEIVWTRGTTEGINLVASSSGIRLRPGDEILLTAQEHYSNLLPWQFLARRTGAQLRFLDVDAQGRLRLDQLDSLLSPRTKMAAFTHVSNVLGGINPAKEICDRAHRAGALALIDAAQSIPHFPVDVQALGCDFLAFSSHKMTGPMGTGVLWARRELLDSLPPYQSGSNMAHEATLQAAPERFSEGGRKFEAGTPNAAGSVGLAAAIQYLESLGRAELWKREQELTKYALSQLREVDSLRILGPTEPGERVSVFSFVLNDSAVPDTVQALDRRGIAIRGGDLAALPLLKRLGVSSAARASCYLYTQTSDIDALVQTLKDFTVGQGLHQNARP
jgi:cysteine desulfurase / selenocysteine lyase